MSDQLDWEDEDEDELPQTESTGSVIAAIRKSFLVRTRSAAATKVAVEVLLERSASFTAEFTDAKQTLGTDDPLASEKAWEICFRANEGHERAMKDAGLEYSFTIKEVE